MPVDDFRGECPHWDVSCMCGYPSLLLHPLGFLILTYIEVQGILTIEGLCIKLRRMNMNFDKNLLGGTTGLLLLSLLSDQDMYGYEIIKELERRSDSSFQFKEGTLYPVLHKLENMGWLKSYLSKGDAGRERKYYQITVKGKKQLTLEKEQWEVFTQSVEKVVFGGQYELAR